MTIVRDQIYIFKFRIKFIFSSLTAPWYMSTSLFVKYFISCKISHFSFLILSMFHFLFLILSVFHFSFPILSVSHLLCITLLRLYDEFWKHRFLSWETLWFAFIEFCKKLVFFSGKPSGFLGFISSFFLFLRLAFASLLERKRTFKCLLTGGNVSSVIYSQLL